MSLHIHFYLIIFTYWIQLIEDNKNFSKIMSSIKGNFTANYKNAYHIDHRISFWQRRFWDHIIRNEKDLKIHMDYIHWNPVKHDLVCRPEDWANSSYIDWVRRGVYTIGWGVNDLPKGLKGLNYE